MRLASILCGTAVAFMLVVDAAPAQTTEQNWEQCQNGPPGNVVINACTALIDSNQDDARIRSEEYTFRGLSYETLGENDKALADFRTALQLDPGNSGARLEADALSQ